jgi:hypothetical protein
MCSAEPLRAARSRPPSRAALRPSNTTWLPSATDTSLLVQQQPGDYALTVVDANGCQDSASASIALLGMLTLMVDGQHDPFRCNIKLDII